MAEPRVVVGLDFGTTFSGFAFAHQADPQDIHTFYEWPMQAKGGGKPYCKTQTSLYYVRNAGKSRGASDPEFVLKDWAWPAQVQYLEALQAASKNRSQQASDSGTVSIKGQQAASASVRDVQQEVGFFVRRFKLHLASASDRTGVKESSQNEYKQEKEFSPEKKGKEKSKEQEIGLKKRFGFRFLKAFSSSSSSKTPQDVETKAEEVSKVGPVPAESALVKRTPKAETGNGNVVYGELPPGVTVEKAIADYLGSISAFIMSHLQSTYGKHLSRRDVQWCLTVPAIWDDKAKQQMRYCAQRAGLVTGPYCPSEMADAASLFPLIIVLESEAASVYCTKKSKQLSLQTGAQFLVADVGGGTVDIVVHVTDSDGAAGTKIREVKQSMGGLCGGTFVDRNFMDFLSRKVSCFSEFVHENPLAIAALLRKWEDLKCSFDGTLTSGLDFELPTKLAKAWQLHEAMELAGSGLTPRESYDEIEITKQDMLGIFDPVVDQILSLIKDQMSPSIQVLMMVGGFSASPYLMKRVHQTFSKQVKEILCPPDPGSAICQGAVVLGVSPDIIMARISRKTYGINEYRDFVQHKDPANLLEMVDGKPKCKDVFCVFVKKGEEVSVNQCVEKKRYPVYSRQKVINVELYSALDPNPRYITDPGVKLEGSFVINIPEDANNLDTRRCVAISLYFGRSCIQVKAKRQNFGNTSEVFQGLDNIEFMHEGG